MSSRVLLNGFFVSDSPGDNRYTFPHADGRLGAINIIRGRGVPSTPNTELSSLDYCVLPISEGPSCAHKGHRWTTSKLSIREPVDLIERVGH